MTQSKEAADAEKFLVFPLIVLIMAQMGTSGDNGALSIATAQLTTALNASMSDIQLANTMYSLVAGALMVAGGMTGTIIGWKKNFRIGCLLAAIGEVIMALSPNITIFTWGGRFIVGFGASFLVPSVLGLVPKIYISNKSRALAFGGIGAATGLSTFLPLIFGTLLEFAGFRITFGILGCYFLLVFACSFRFPEVAKEERRLKLDTIGIILASSGLFMVILGVSHISSWGLITAYPTAPISLGGFSPALPLTVCGLIVLAILIKVEKKVEAKNGCALIPESFLASRQVIAGVIASFITFFFMGILAIALNPYLMLVLGLNAITVALLSLVYGIAMFVVSMFLPKVMKNPNPRHILAAGYIIMALAGVVYAMSITQNGITIPLVLLANLFGGISSGLCASQASTVVALALNPRDAAQSGGVQATARNIGQAVAVALLGSVLLFSISSGVSSSVASNPAFSPEVSQAISSQNISLSSNEKALAQVEKIVKMTSEEEEEFVNIYSMARLNGSRIAFIVGAISVLLTIPTTAWIKTGQSKKRKEDKKEEDREEE